MTIEKLTPRSRDEWLSGRSKTVGASEIAALFGAHPWMSPYELFAIKSGLYEKEFAEIKIEENSIHLPPTARGNLLEEPAFELIKMLRPTWTVEPNQIPGGTVFVDTEARFSATPDCFLTAPDRPGRGACQIKSVADMVFRKSWQAQSGLIEPPLAVAIQAIADATLSGCDWACVGALVVGFSIDFFMIDVALRPKLMAKARDLTKDFWRRVAEKDPYAPDFAKDGAIISALYADDDGGVIDLSSNNRMLEVVADRAGLKEIEKAGSDAEKGRKQLDLEIIAALGNHAAGFLADGTVIEAKTIRRKAYAVQESQYRTVKVKGGANGAISEQGPRSDRPAAAPKRGQHSGGIDPNETF